MTSRISKKLCIASNGRVKIFCERKNMDYIINGNLSEDYPGFKNLHLKKRVISILAKNLPFYIEQ